MYGALGNAYKRFKASQNIEQSGARFPFNAFTTGEKLEVYVEEVAYNRTAAPSIGTKRHGSGGVVRVLLRSV